MYAISKIVYLLILVALVGFIVVNDWAWHQDTAAAGQLLRNSKSLSRPYLVSDRLAQSHSVSKNVQQFSLINSGEKPRKMKLAFAITITSDGSVEDGSCVLAYSIIKTHQDLNYDISFIAFVHPNVTNAIQPLQRFGYQIIRTPTPINESAIQGKFLREHINDKAGCCGAKELIKLYSYRLVQFDWVIHVDVDVLFLQSLKDILHFTNYSILYTHDPNMAGSKIWERQPAQGGFLVIRPNLRDYQTFIEVLMKGDYRSGSAWGGSKIGWFWGGKTIQGIIPYYYNKITAPNRSLILDRCIFDTMADSDICNNKTIDEVVCAHFTVCQKPWSCSAWQQNPLCVSLHESWFKLRREAEHYFGIPDPGIEKHCAKGRKGYRKIDATYASPPQTFLDRFNLVKVPDSLDPTCGSGYVGLNSCEVVN